MLKPAFSLMPHGSLARVVELARLAERLGYERCWVYDEGLAARDVYVTMIAIALATESLEIGPGITNPYTRHAGVTAGAIAAVDELSAGRAFLGIGAGGSLTLGPLAIERSRPLNAVRETIRACRGLFAGETVTVDGEVVRLREASLLHPRPRPDIEIWLAGRGPRMLELGGSVCDGVYLDFVYKPELPEITSRINHAAGLAGRVVGKGGQGVGGSVHSVGTVAEVMPGSPAEVLGVRGSAESVGTGAVQGVGDGAGDGDGQDAGGVADEGAGAGIGEPRIAYSTMLVTDEASLRCAKLNMTYRLVDSPPEVQAAIEMASSDVEAIRAAMADGLPAAARLVRDDWIRPFVVAGTPAECRTELQSLADEHGFDSFVVPLLDDSLAEDLLHVGAEVLGRGGT